MDESISIEIQTKYDDLAVIVQKGRYRTLELFALLLNCDVEDGTGMSPFSEAISSLAVSGP